jgi:hypothetical protein
MHKGRLVVALLYVAALSLWLMNGYGVLLDGIDFLLDDAGGFLVVIAGGILAGLLIGRWWAAALPLTAFVTAMTLQSTGSTPESGYAESLGPVEVALLVAIPFGAAACAAGVLLHMWARSARRAPGAKRRG